MYLTDGVFKCENNLPNVPNVLRTIGGTHDEAVFGCVLYEGIVIPDGGDYTFNVGTMIITPEIANVINLNMNVHGCTENFQLNAFPSTTALHHIYSESDTTVDVKITISYDQSEFDGSLSKYHANMSYSKEFSEVSEVKGSKLNIFANDCKS